MYKAAHSLCHNMDFVFGITCLFFHVGEQSSIRHPELVMSGSVRFLLTKQLLPVLSSHKAGTTWSITQTLRLSACYSSASARSWPGGSLMLSSASIRQLLGKLSSIISLLSFLEVKLRALGWKLSTSFTGPRQENCIEKFYFLNL